MVMDKMKLKITIIGGNVHNVGYRYFLMNIAINLGLDGFNARNIMKGNEQQVVALIEGEEEAIAEFKMLAESQRPEHSLVSSILFEDTNSKVMKTEKYAQICTAVQLNKAIPLLLDERGYPAGIRSPIPAGAGRYPGDKGAPGNVLILKSIL